MILCPHSMMRAPRLPPSFRLAAIILLTIITAPLLVETQGSTPWGQTHLENIQAVGAHYLPGDTVTVTGHGFAASCAATIEVNRPDGANANAGVLSDSAGNIAVSYPLDAVTGEYSIRATTIDGATSLAMTSFASGPFVVSNKSDYLPDETVTFSGRGFEAGEPVSLVVRQTYPGVDERTFIVVADHTGAFANSDLVLTATDVNTTMLVTATGSVSGRSAQHVFSSGTATQVQKSTNATTTAAATSLTSTYGVAPTTGNLLVGVIGIAQPVSIAAPTAGWLLAPLGDDPPTQTIFYKLAEAGASTSVVVDLSAATFTNTGNITVSFSAGAKRLIRSAGNWADDGFAVGQTITTSNPLNPGPFTITALNSATDLTVSEPVVVASGITTVSGAGTTGTITLYEYSGVLANIDPSFDPFVGIAGAAGTDSPVSSGSMMLAADTNHLLIAAITARAGGTTIDIPSSGSPSNGFTATAPTAGVQVAAGTARVTTQTLTRPYGAVDSSSSMAATAGSFPWFGHIVAFKTKTAPTTAIGVSPPGPVVLGQAVTLTATISPGGASGSVSFQDGASTIAGCASVPVDLDQATCITSSLPVGTHAGILAVYSGDDEVHPSTSPSLTPEYAVHDAPVPYTLTGFYEPVDMATTNMVVINTVKGGSTVPLKFNVYRNASEISSTAGLAFNYQESIQVLLESPAIRLSLGGRT